MMKIYEVIDRVAEAQSVTPKQILCMLLDPLCMRQKCLAISEVPSDSSVPLVFAEVANVIELCGCKDEPPKTILELLTVWLLTQWELSAHNAKAYRDAGLDTEAEQIDRTAHVQKAVYLALKECAAVAEHEGLEWGIGITEFHRKRRDTPPNSGPAT